MADEDRTRAPDGAEDRRDAGRPDATRTGSPGFDAAAAVPAVPESIGPYRILGVLGEGGMGVVYEAEQASPRRTVAVKVVRGGAFVDDAHLRMFRREAETLARLRHPGIAAIYESGRTEAGQHFFAMELVRGRNLGQWIDGRPRRIDAAELRLRLAVFREICDAVQYAHQRGVIHRDLKPSNIVVTEPDEAASGTKSGGRHGPAIKILDFGLARITDSDIAAATVVTEVGMIKGTLAYMSPEQARGQIEDVDVRTDVYALGVILYEMLTRSRPYDLDRSALLEAVRVICEKPPAPLSETWSGVRRVDRDVETIVGKALEKEPGRRYATAAALSDDVQRYLDSEPILARPPSAAYQMRKFAQRNRGLVVGVAAVAAALVLGFAATAWGLHRASQEAERATRVSEFVKDMIKGAGPDVAQGGDATVLRGILDRAAERVDTELAGQPRIEIDLRDTIGQTYMGIGDQDKAAAQLEAAWERSRDVLGAEAPETLDAMRHLGIVRSRQGRYAEAEKLYTDALAIHERHRTGDGRSAVATRHCLGVLRLETGRDREAIELLEPVVAARVRDLGPEHDQTLQSRTALGLALLNVGRTDEAEAQLSAVLDIRKRTEGDTHPRTIEAVYNLAGLLSRTSRLDDAVALFRDALSRMETVYGPDHPRTIRVRSVLGGTLSRGQRLGEAETTLTRALDDARRVLGDDHPTTLDVEAEMGSLRRNQGRLDEAFELLQTVRERRRAILGDDDPLTLAAGLRLLQVLTQARRLDEAEPLGSELVEASRRVRGPDHPETLLIDFELGNLHAAMKRWDDAETHYRTALDGRRRTLGDRHPDTLVSCNALAVLYMRMGDFARALPQLTETLELQRATIGADDPNTVITQYNLGHARANLGQLDEAEAAFVDAAERFERVLGPDHGYTKAAKKALAEFREKHGRPAD